MNTSVRRLGWIALVALALIAPGCSGMVAGSWKQIESNPRADVFSLRNLEMKRDGTYTVQITSDGVTRRERGEYAFNGFELTFLPESGGKREWPAELRGYELHIGDSERNVVLLRR